jgi:S-adenosylmethionine:tRNA ribosyltransferase-isomerase
MRTADFLYDLPEEAIAQVPLEPRDASRLLDTRSLTDRVFSDLPGLLSAGDLLVVNRTRVRAARLRGWKSETGGAVELLLLGPVDRGRWEALVRPARRIRPGIRLEFEGLTALVVDGPTQGTVLVELEPGTGDDVESVIAAIGEVPLPPYIRRPLDHPERYQTVYAEEVGSAAAPTAGLHITDRVLTGLSQRGIETAVLDLEVGVDTFRPIGTPSIEDHQMHRERYRIPAETAAAVKQARERGGKVVAVGTTVVRALESAATHGGKVDPMEGSTDLFISPGYRFNVIDALVTNFHVPGSTLVVLVAAALGERWRQVYETALDRGYRFLSFGDAMYAEITR